MHQNTRERRGRCSSRFMYLPKNWPFSPTSKISKCIPERINEYMRGPSLRISFLRYDMPSHSIFNKQGFGAFFPYWQHINEQLLRRSPCSHHIITVILKSRYFHSRLHVQVSIIYSTNILISARKMETVCIKSLTPNASQWVKQEMQ